MRHHRARRGRAKAAVAVAMLIITYHVLMERLMEGTLYGDLGGTYFDERDRQGVARRLINRLQDLGYGVTLVPQAAA